MRILILVVKQDIAEHATARKFRSTTSAKCSVVIYIYAMFRWD